MGLLKKILAATQVLPKHIILVLLLVLSAGFLRFYNLENSSQFLGDQGRDALIVANIFTKRDIVTIGPTTSVGNIYLGPFYYYFMLPFLWLSYPSPIGPVYAVAVLGTITVFFLYYWGRRLVGEQAAIFAAFSCAFSVIAINLSRFSWNPNPSPFVMLCLMYAAFLAVTKHPKYWLGVGIAFAVLLQLHYVTLLAGASAGLIWLGQLIQTIQSRHPWKPLVGYAIGVVAIVLISLTPLVLFDLKHGAPNIKALQNVFFGSDNFAGTTNESKPLSDVLRETHGRSMHILYEFQIGKNRPLNTALVIVVLVSTLALLLRKKKDQYYIGLSHLFIYLLVGVLGFSFYKNSVFDHYIVFLFPVTFLFLGYYLNIIWSWNSLGKILVVASLLYFLNYNVSRYNFQPHSANFAELRTVADSIHRRIQPGEQYGIVLLSATKDFHAMNYRYFLSTESGKEPLPHSEHGWAELLFVIDEEKKTNTPEEIDIFEINSFNKPQVVERYTIPNGPNITVLKKGR